MTKAFVTGIHGFVAARGLELVHFGKGQHKDDLAHEFLARFTQNEGVLFVDRAQEKAGVWRTQRRYNPGTGGSYAWQVRSSAFINFFYFYCVDADFGRSSSSSAPTSPTPPSSGVCAARHSGCTERAVTWTTRHPGYWPSGRAGWLCLPREPVTAGLSALR